MTFAAKLADAAARVERHLSAVLTGDGGDDPPERLTAAMRHGALAGGKRLRPFLVLESAGLFGVAPEQAIATGAALELVHCYSLVHDDLPAMDDDDLRRGKPTVHKAFDDWTAILAGDGLLTLAFEVLAAETWHPNAAIRARLVLALARAAGPAGMVGGQCLDLEAEKLGGPRPLTLAHVDRLQAMKTGALIRFACEAGGILGRADAAETAALTRYGTALGQAFQISDDLLDAEGDAAVVGKDVGKDAAVGKATIVAVLGPTKARRRLAEVEAAAVAALDPFGARADTLREAARFVSTRNR